MNMSMQISLQDPVYNSFGYITIIDIARSYGISVINFFVSNDKRMKRMLIETRRNHLPSFNRKKRVLGARQPKRSNKTFLQISSIAHVIDFLKNTLLRYD